ncbi:MAG: NAD(P)/FAD-dependent oxidoreductase [Phycisphaerales bacterium]|nr:NAD(P)/FAD-dependent oxidoreductase [Phycisphaerales bacterium]
MSQSTDGPPRVLILGGGFAGLYCARRLAGANARVTLLDRTNHHLFQPLLYQVATASLSPADIASPIRWVLRRQANCRVLLGEAAAIDPDARLVTLADGSALGYDYLVVALGVSHAYFGHDEWAPLAPGLKDLRDALDIRNRFLSAFERAERETDPAAQRALLTFVIVGGGPTGVELAGAIAEIARKAMPRDFRAVDTRAARIVLVEGSPRLLSAYSPRASVRAYHDLERLGVEVRLDTHVVGVDSHGVTLDNPAGKRIDAATVLWAAGVRASPLGARLGAPTDRQGRVIVEPDLTIPGRPEVFVAGDLARVTDPATGREIPGVAPAAMQMGRHAGALIARELLRAPSPPPSPALPPARPSFVYRDKGTLATIGRARAVGSVWGLAVAGYPAWMLWLLVHILYLAGFRNRIVVLINWAWAYITYQRGARLITKE